MHRSGAGTRVAAALLTAGAAGLAAVLAPSAAVLAAPAAPASPRSLMAWGDDGEGQLGDGMTGTLAKTPVTVKLPPGTKVASFRAGCDSSVVLTQGGRVLDFGSGAFGQLGNGKKTGSAVPVQARFPVGTKITAVRAGCDYNLALTAAGRVFAWGQNPADGQLTEVANVRPRAAAAAAALPAPVRFPAGTRITAVSAGWRLSLALTARGQVYAWGHNNFGELGTGTTKTSRVPVRVKLPAGVTVTAVAAGQDFAVAQTSTGGLLAWGDNGQGELGTGHMGGISKVPVRVKLPGGTKVRGMFAGCSHALVLTGARKVLAWGRNVDGQLGDGTNTSRATPGTVQIPSGTTVTAISAGCFDSLALDSAGDVLAWGGGSNGELGDGKGQDSPLPVQVALPPGDTLTIAAGPVAFSGLALVQPTN